VFSDPHKTINTLCGQDVVCGPYTNHWSLKGYVTAFRHQTSHSPLVFLFCKLDMSACLALLKKTATESTPPHHSNPRSKSLRLPPKVHQSLAIRTVPIIRSCSKFKVAIQSRKLYYFTSHLIPFHCQVLLPVLHLYTSSEGCEQYNTSLVRRSG